MLRVRKHADVARREPRHPGFCLSYERAAAAAFVIPEGLRGGADGRPDRAARRGRIQIGPES